MTSKTEPLQMTLEQLEQGKQIYIPLDQIVPNERLESPEPTSEFVQSVYEKGILTPIIVIQNEIGEYYPMAGKRRVKSLRILAAKGLEYLGVPFDQFMVPAVLLENVCEGSITASLLEFIENNLRSSNPLTDIEAVETAATYLGANLHTPQGRKEIAKYLNVSPAKVQKIAKGVRLPETVKTALNTSQISLSTFNAIADMTDLQARAQVVKRLTEGEELVTADIKKYNKVAVQSELASAMGHVSSDLFDLPTDNPLEQALALLRSIPATVKYKTEIAEAIALLEELT